MLLFKRAAILNKKRLPLKIDSAVFVNQIILKMNLTSYFIAPFTVISEMTFNLDNIFCNFTTMDQD